MATYKYTKLNRRGYEVVLPSTVYQELRNNDCTIQLVLHKNSDSKTVEIRQNNKYMGTLKEAMGVKAFKDGNPCNFRVSNLIEIDE